MSFSFYEWEIETETPKLDASHLVASSINQKDDMAVFGLARGRQNVFDEYLPKYLFELEARMNMVSRWKKNCKDSFYHHLEVNPDRLDFEWYKALNILVRDFSNAIEMHKIVTDEYMALTPSEKRKLPDLDVSQTETFKLVSGVWRGLPNHVHLEQLDDFKKFNAELFCKFENMQDEEDKILFEKWQNEKKKKKMRDD